jgi:hypothetical protein
LKTSTHIEFGFSFAGSPVGVGFFFLVVNNILVCDTFQRSANIRVLYATMPFRCVSFKDEGNKKRKKREKKRDVRSSL